MIRLADNPDQRIGSISLYDQPGNHRGFWLSPAWQGRGYMQEACKVINRYWFDTLDRPVMQVPKAVANAASRRVSEREGMRLVEVTEGEFVSGRLNKEIWELRQEDWARLDVCT
jgi:RimJ/RimL family protein N-acetyltransferase